MSIHEHQRYSLHQALAAQLGPENAATLMAYLPPVGWADVATKHDLLIVRNDLDALEQRLDLRFETINHRIAAEIADVRTEIHRSVRTMTITFVAATTAIVSAIAALTNLFG